MGRLFLGTLTVTAGLGLALGGCADEPAPKSPPAVPAPARTSAPIASAPTPPNVTDGAASDAAARAFPPAPWSIVADASSERQFLRYQLDNAAVWAVCYLHPFTDGCLQPELAIERDDRLEPVRALEPGMPKLEWIDLRREPEGHWKTVGHKSNDLPRPCEVDQYVGPRAMTGLYGRYPDNVWMTVDRSGEEPVMSSITTLFRFEASWKVVPTRHKLGERISRLFRWHGGMLAQIDHQGQASRFEVFATPAGVRPPRLPKNARLEAIVVHPDGAITAHGGEDLSLVGLIGWSPRDPRPITIELRMELAGGYTDEAIGAVQMTRPDQVEVLGYGEIPVEKKATSEMRHDRVRVTLSLERGRWKVVEQKLETWKSPPVAVEFPPRVPGLDAHPGFSVKRLIVANGVTWVVGEIDQGGERRAFLLRQRPVASVWHTTATEQKFPPRELVPGCDPNASPSP